MVPDLRPIARRLVDAVSREHDFEGVPASRITGYGKTPQRSNRNLPHRRLHLRQHSSSSGARSNHDMPSPR
jgi:hypothetical protein